MLILFHNFAFKFMYTLLQFNHILHLLYFVYMSIFVIINIYSFMFCVIQNERDQYFTHLMGKSSKVKTDLGT